MRSTHSGSAWGIKRSMPKKTQQQKSAVNGWWCDGALYRCIFTSYTWSTHLDNSICQNDWSEKMGPSKRTSCLTSSAPWLVATPFLPSNQYPSFQESWSPYGTHSCTMLGTKHVYATANKETILAPLGMYEITRNQMGPGLSDFG